MSERFDEKSLFADIVKQWGAYGAHADVFLAMINEIERLKKEVEKNNESD